MKYRGKWKHSDFAEAITGESGVVESSPSARLIAKSS
jgi:hypothetical protein